MEKPNYKHFIFDYDGVLCDSLGVAIEAFNEIRKDHFPLLPEVRSKEEFSSIFSGYIRNCLSAWLNPIDSKRFFKLHLQKMQCYTGRSEIFVKIVGVLNSFPLDGLSIITSSYATNIIQTLERLEGLHLNRVYKIHGRETNRNKKENIINLIEELGLLPADVLYIGDTENDILYCRSIPVDILAVGYGYNTTDRLRRCNPEYMVENIAELSILLDTLKKS